jgi:hypothetical protein
MLVAYQDWRGTKQLPAAAPAETGRGGRKEKIRAKV